MRFAVPVVLVVAGCVATDDAVAPPVQSRVVPFEFGGMAGVNWTAATDVLLVVDSSPAIAPYRDALVASYHRFGAALEVEPGILPDLRVAVVTADLGADGCVGDGGFFRTAPNVSGEYVIDRAVSSTEREINYGGDLGDAIAALADAGSGGCDVSRPIDAMKLALRTANGFHRPNAYLLIVFVAAADDSSSTSIADAVDLLRDVADEHHLAIGVIGGPDDGTCGAPAARLRELAAQTAYEPSHPDDNNAFSSLCDADHDTAVTVLSKVYRAVLAGSCVTSIAIPYECTAEDVYPTDDGGEGRDVLAACDVRMTNRPCWYFRTSQPTCFDSADNEFRVARASPPVLGTWTVGQCLAAP